MSRDWIGIAEDLTERGVIGCPYAQPSTPTPSNVGIAGYPSPPKNGRTKTFLIVAGIVAAGVLTPPGEAIVTSLKSKFLSSPSASEAQSSSAKASKPAINNTSPTAQSIRPNQAASAAPQQLADEPEPKKKQVQQKQATISNDSSSPTETTTSERATDTHTPAAESDVDLTKYRNLTGRI